MNYIVYGIECPRTGRILYVGKTNSLQSRIIAHLNTDSNITWWLDEIKEDGLKPIFKILCKTETNDMAKVLEVALINHYSKQYCTLNRNSNYNYKLSKHIHAKSNS